jgi:fructokinase
MRLGIDLGGTKIEGVLLTASGEVAAKSRVSTPAKTRPTAYAETLEAISALTSELEAAAGARAKTVGIGIPGSPSPKTGLVRNANSEFLNGNPFGADVARVLARPVRVANDANCFALSEASDGAGAGNAIVFGVIIGTGCGGGVVVDGKIINGAAGVAGEWGHMPLPWMRPDEYPGHKCWCGKPGCMETFVSGPWFLKDYLARPGATQGDGQSARDIAARAAAHPPEAAAVAAMADFADRMARGLAVIISTIDPDIVVLGGGVSNIDVLPGMIEARLPALVFSDHVATRVVKNLHGDSSGVRGAAWLFSVAEAV